MKPELCKQWVGHLLFESFKNLTYLQYFCIQTIFSLNTIWEKALESLVIWIRTTVKILRKIDQSMKIFFRIASAKWLVLSQQERCLVPYFVQEPPYWGVLQKLEWARYRSKIIKSFDKMKGQARLIHSWSSHDIEAFPLLHLRRWKTAKYAQYVFRSFEQDPLSTLFSTTFYITKTVATSKIRSRRTGCRNSFFGK